MVSETTFPERRTSLRAVSRPSQLAFGVALLAVLSGCVTYALLAGLPPQLGLYVSIFPVIAYALLGSSMVLLPYVGRDFFPYVDTGQIRLQQQQR